LANALIAAGYLCWGIGAHRAGERASYVLRAVCMLLCPVVVAAFLLTGALVRRIFFRKPVDLDGLLFRTGRETYVMKADEEQEKNLIPMEEALAISDYGDLRALMMNVIKGDVEQSLSAISMALDSEDSETSHYAASVLSKALNDFRMNVQKIRQEMRQEKEQGSGDHAARDSCGPLLFDYMDRFLKQHVFTDIEQEYFVGVMRELAEELYEGVGMNARQYAELAQRLMEIGDYENAGIWCDRAIAEYPRELSSYRCRLRLLFLKEEREEFFAALQALKSSGIAIDSETMEMIRIFQ
jgi:tetratricopeptide (TPR) repeat protein